MDTRTKILKVALQLFLKKGYKDVTYKDLIAKTGFSKGAIYHHFESKEDLLASVFEYLLEATKQPVAKEPKIEVTDIESFRKLFIETKKWQIAGFKKLVGSKSLKINKILFFLEAINENEKLRNTVVALISQELIFIEKCFIGLECHNSLPKNKGPKKMAECLFWMLQGTEMKIFMAPNNEVEDDLLNAYNKTIEDFFSII